MGGWDGVVRRGEAASDYRRPEDKVIRRLCRLSEPRLRPRLYSKPVSRRANTYHYVNNKLACLSFNGALRIFSLPSSPPSSPSLRMNIGSTGCCFSFFFARPAMDRTRSAAASPLPSHDSSLKSTSSAGHAHSCHTASVGWSAADCNSFNAAAADSGVMACRCHPASGRLTPGSW